jgi:hypothetical protein
MRLAQAPVRRHVVRAFIRSGRDLVTLPSDDEALSRSVTAFEARSLSRAADPIAELDGAAPRHRRVAGGRRATDRGTDAALVYRNDKGRLKIYETRDLGAKAGALRGAAVGLLVSIVALPAVIAATAVGAGAGALIGKARESGRQLRGDPARGPGVHPRGDQAEQRGLASRSALGLAGPAARPANRSRRGRNPKIGSEQSPLRGCCLLGEP